MSGRHAARPVADHSGRHVALLGLIALIPPALVLGPRAIAAPAKPAGIERPDIKAAQADPPVIGRAT
ncbi:hypothetical protein ACFYNL_38335 [Streptomyces sp. NPDC007808]|uniref:hypothetical protein n=1 Tax=Streptomyces sp. NPDC007808 TaxID=3364779 RepID=UPI0036912E97